MTKVFLINFNRLTTTRNMAEYLADTGMEVVIVDNLSSYQPLLEWYKDAPYEIIMLKKNWGHLCLWQTGLVDEFDDRFYAVSDTDLDLSSVPTDYESFLMKGLENNKDVFKSGLSLRIDDLPVNEFTKKVIAWEKKFWTGKKDKDGFVRADVDSTFAIYDKQRNFGELPPEENKFFWAVRSPEKYSCRHTPWYHTQESVEADPEEKYYHNSVNTYWSQKMKETWK